MYTDKQYERDLYLLSTTYMVKKSVLKDVIENDGDIKALTDALTKAKKTPEEIHECGKRVTDIKRKYAGGIDKHPAADVYSLRKRGDTEGAYKLIAPYVTQNPLDVDAQKAFGWVMYDYLKASQGNDAAFIKTLTKLNDTVKFSFETDDEFYNTLIGNLVFQIMKALRGQGRLPDNLPQEILRFMGGTAAFLENENIKLHTGEYAGARLRKSLNDRMFEEENEDYLRMYRHVGY